MGRRSRSVNLLVGERSRLTRGMIRLWALGNLIYLTLQQCTRAQMSTNIVGRIISVVHWKVQAPKEPCLSTSNISCYGFLTVPTEFRGRHEWPISGIEHFTTELSWSISGKIKLSILWPNHEKKGWNWKGENAGHGHDRKQEEMKTHRR